MASDILHLHSMTEASVIEILERQCQIPPAQSKDLLSLGAVYIDKKRVLKNCLVHQGQYLRVHTRPKRYKVPDDISKFILHSSQDFLIIDKPANIPCHASLDNFQENILTLLKTKTGEDFYITHRLDVPTSGCLLLARTKSFQSLFNNLLLERKVQKKYQAIVRGDLSAALSKITTFGTTYKLVHWMKKSLRSPKELLTVDEYKQCQNPLDYMLSELEFIAVKYDPINNLSEICINLITGRTHQIRAQLAKIGFPILGDTTYGGPENNILKLRCEEITFEFQGQEGLVPVRVKCPSYIHECQ